jgi:mannitol-1-phosphate 5-dehydrogenase
MALEGTRTYVGFGLGAIQAGLFLYEAQKSGGFRRLVVAEVVPERVESVRRAGGKYTVNVAHSDRIQSSEVGPVEIEDPSQEADRERLVEAIAEAEEIGTAIPSVSFYVSPCEGSIHRILAAGLRRKAERDGPRAVVYAAENHNRAAEILEENVLSEVPEVERDAVSSRVRFLNTVIGKMSGVVTDPADVRERKLVTITPHSADAFLVESFNHILISRVRFPEGQPPFQRGVSVFEEKDDLLPFEEAKLYGHNATHAVAAYVGAVCGAARIADLKEKPGVMWFLRRAFLEESGEALIRRHGPTDALFTPEGYREYADDLLERMTNPYLGDTVERVGRDPERKLGWDDRLVGTMRVALSQGITPQRYAVGTAAAVVTVEPPVLDQPALAEGVLRELWKDASPSEDEAQTVTRLTLRRLEVIKNWRDSGFPDLESLYNDVLVGRLQQKE